MALRMCILGSSSKGNSIYVASERTAVLIDAGLSAKQIKLRLERIGVRLAQIDAVCISHEHSDHVRGLRVLLKNSDMRLYANAGTAGAVARIDGHHKLNWSIFTTGSPFTVGDLTVTPFALPHDAYEPVGYTVESGADKIGIATDLGMVTTLARARLRGCRALVLEANHDERMLAASQRPWSLKQRIMGRQGHLSNEAAAEALTDCADQNLKRVYLAHLSDECNRMVLAKEIVGTALRKSKLEHIELSETYPDRESECWES
jgi:phosphoribosyl 1,2-cyclic phosphodiesterase